MTRLPITAGSPGTIRARWTFSAATNTPLMLPKSSIQYSPPSSTMRACRRDTTASSVRIWHSVARPIITGSAPRSSDFSTLSKS